MGVAQLYHHLAPRSEVSLVTKAMIRLLRSHREVQSVVLTCIASMTTQRKVSVRRVSAVGVCVAGALLCVRGWSAAVCGDVAGALPAACRRGVYNGTAAGSSATRIVSHGSLHFYPMQDTLECVSL